MTPEEIKKLQEETVKLIKEGQEKHEKGIKDTSDKLIEEGTKRLEQIQGLEAKMKAQDETIKFLEKQLSRVPSPKGETEDKYRNEYTKYLRKGVQLPDDVTENVIREIVNKNFIGVNEGFANSKTMEMKAMVEGVDPEGGYWVRPEISNRILTRIFETSPIRQVASTVTIGTNEIKFIIDDNEFSSGGWVGEVATRGDTDNSQIGEVSIFAHEQFAQPKATQSLIDDAGFDIEGYIARKVSDKFARTENTAFVSGDGTNKPKGFLAYSAWTTPGTYERGKLEQRTSNVSASFDANDLIKLQNDLKEFYGANAVWMMKRATFGIISTLDDGSGRYLLNPLMLAEGANKILLGKRVIFADDMPAVASNALSVAYGDFREGYTIVDRIGMRVLRDPYTSKPYVKFYTTKRTGGAVTNYESIKILKIKA